MGNFDLRKFIANEKASFLSEGYDEFQRVDKGKKGVAKKDKGEEEVYGAGVKKGEKLEKEKLKEEDKKLTYSDFVDMVRADMRAGAASDEYASDERVGKEAKWKYNEYLQGTSLDDLFLYEATKEEENEFHKDLDKLVHKTFGHSSDEKKKMANEEQEIVDYDFEKNDIPSIKITLSDDMPPEGPEGEFQISALYHSGNNGKMSILQQNPGLQKAVTALLQKEFQKTFRKVIHGVLGEPFGLKEMDDKNMNEIGMFHDPRMSGDFKDADDAWENGAYHVRFRMLKNKGVGEEKAKELADTYEDKPWEEVKELLNLNEVNIFDINPKAKEVLEKLMAKGMSEKDAKKAITDQMNAADRESERDKKRAFTPMEEMDNPEEKEKKPYSLGQALFLLSDENEKEVRAWKRKIADDIKANGTEKYLKWGAKDFVDDFKKSLDEINEQMLDSETAIKKFLGRLIEPETMRRVGNTGNFTAKTRTGKVVLIEITPSGGGAIVYELDKEGKKLNPNAPLDRATWGRRRPSLDK